MDAYKILGVDRKSTLDSIKKKFKQLALELHPDKGGNEHMFNLVKESYVYVLQDIKNASSSKDFMDLKGDHTTYINNPDSQKRNVKLEDINEDSLKKQFHKVFNESNSKTVDSRGYGKYMVETDHTKEITIEKKIKKFSLDGFNKEFDNAKPLNTKHLIQSYNPEPFSLSPNLSFTELGLDKIIDFSDGNESKDLQYTDYMKAHTTNVLHANIKTKERTIDDIENERASIKYVMDDKELYKYEKNKMKLQKKEDNRVIHLQKQDNNIEKMFHKVNKSMLKYK